MSEVPVKFWKFRLSDFVKRTDEAHLDNATFPNCRAPFVFNAVRTVGVLRTGPARA